MSGHKGYLPTFMKENLDFPGINQAFCAPLIKDASSHEIKYTHYSSFQHKDRMLPLMTAVNIRGEEYNAPSREGNEPWDFSEQILEKYQLDNDFYGKDKGTFDRGHLVRRVDPCWGDDKTVDAAELETFRWTNCTPQHKKLNQKGGVWYELEQHVMEHGVKNKIADVSVFAGPVLDNHDRAFKIQYKGKDIKIPNVFWKVIVWKKNSDNKLYAVGFMMSQYEFIKDMLTEPHHAFESVRLKEVEKKLLEDQYFETLQFGDHKTYQVPISAIEKATGIQFSKWKNVHYPYAKRDFTVIGHAEVKPYRLKALNEVFKTNSDIDHQKARDMASKMPIVDHNFGDVRKLQLSNITL